MTKIHKARVFEGHKCTTGIHNALLDVVMPELSATTWKILCVLIRQTTGWDRKEQGASYTSLMNGTGIKSKATIAACLDELKSYRYQLIAIQPGRQHEESRYAVNRDVEIDWIPQNFAYSSGSKDEPLRQSSGSKNEPNYGSKNEPLNDLSGSKNELSYMKESINLKERGKERARVEPSEPSINHQGGEPSPAILDVSAIWQDVFSEPINIHQQSVLESESIACEETLRAVLTIWNQNGYSRRNLSGMIARYHDELAKRKSVSATSPIQSVPLNIPPGLSPGETKRFIEAHIAQLKAA